MVIEPRPIEASRRRGMSARRVGKAGWASIGLLVLVAATAQAGPTLSGTPPTTAQAGKVYDFAPTVSDAGGTKLTFWASHKPSWATFDTQTGRLTGTPGANDVGTTPPIKISASYPARDTTRWLVMPEFTITVAAATSTKTTTVTTSESLTLSGAPPTTVTAGRTYAFKPTVTNPHGTELTFWASHTPRWATFDKTTGELRGTPTSADVGTTPDIKLSISYVVRGTTRWMSLPIFRITVLASSSSTPQPEPEPAPEPEPEPAPQSPATTLTMSGTPPTSIAVGQRYDFTPTITNPHGTALTFWASYRPSWATFDTKTGRMTGTPGPGDVGTTPEIKLSISYVVRGVTRWMSLPRFTITVQAAPATPDTPPTTSEPELPAGFGNTTLTWLPPTETVSGKALLDLAGYKLLWGTSPGNYTSHLLVSNPGISSWVLEGLAAGTYYFVIVAINKAGEESGFSNMVERVIAP